MPKLINMTPEFLDKVSRRAIVFIEHTLGQIHSNERMLLDSDIKRAFREVSCEQWDADRKSNDVPEVHAALKAAISNGLESIWLPSMSVINGGKCTEIIIKNMTDAFPGLKEMLAPEPNEIARANEATADDAGTEGYTTLQDSVSEIKKAQRVGEIVPIQDREPSQREILLAESYLEDWKQRSRAYRVEVIDNASTFQFRIVHESGLSTGWCHYTQVAQLHDMVAATEYFVAQKNALTIISSDVFVSQWAVRD